MQNNTAILEDGLAVSYKIKCIFTICFSNCTPWYVPKRTEDVKNLHMDVYSGFIHNCQNLEALKMSFSGMMANKLWYIQTME